MNYEEWKESLQHTKDPEYWTNFARFREDILHQLVEYKQHIVAKQLRIAGPQLSILAKLLKGVSNVDKTN